jgi:hypothetical protein
VRLRRRWLWLALIVACLAFWWVLIDQVAG